MHEIKVFDGRGDTVHVHTTTETHEAEKIVEDLKRSGVDHKHEGPTKEEGQ